MENSEGARQDAATPGQRLREARETAGVSPREMADRLNWLLAHVTAIEEDRYETLRNAAFARGYLRAYGRELGLDADELVAGFDSLTGSRGSDAQSMVMADNTASHQGTGLSVVVGVLVAALVVAGIWWQAGDESSDDTTPGVAATAAPAGAGGGNDSATGSADTGFPGAQNPAEAPAAIDTPQGGSADASGAGQSRAPGIELTQAPGAGVSENPVTDLIETRSPDEAANSGVESAPDDSAASTDGTGEILDDRAGSTELAAAGAVAAPAPEQVTDPAVEAEPAATPASGASGPLQFEFSADCWLEVRDGDGALIFADLRGAGDTVYLDGDPPFNILAGNAAAIRLRYLGEPVDVKTRPGRNIARFTVGEQ